MSIEAMVWVLNHSGSRSTDRLVALVLANYANDDGEAWPSGRTLERKAAVSRNTVIDALERLVGAGELEQLWPGDSRRSARYRFTFAQAVGNPEGGADTRRSPGAPPRRTGADLDPSGADTRPSGAPVAPDPSVTHKETTTNPHADVSPAPRARDDSPVDEPTRVHTFDRPMSADEIAAAFAEPVAESRAEPTTDGAIRARGLRNELRDNALERGATVTPIRDHRRQLRDGLTRAAERLNDGRKS